MLSPIQSDKMEKQNYVEDHLQDLLKESEKGNSFLVMTFLSENSYSPQNIDLAFRRCMRNFPKEKDEQEEYIKCIKSFLEHIEDFEFRNEKEDNRTILMEACLLGLKVVFDLILKVIRENSYNVNFNIEDNNNETLLHKIILSQNFATEEEKFEMVKLALELGCDINKENKKGYTPLALSLLTGNSKISEELIKLGANRDHIVSATGDSLLHCAVLGKNPLCVTLFSDENNNIPEILKKIKNQKGETPVDTAVKLGLNKFIQLLGEQSIASSFKLMSMIQPLEEFKQDNYSEALRLLNDMKDGKESSLSLEWNILLTQYMQYLQGETNGQNNSSIIDSFFSFFKILESEENYKISKNNLLFYNLSLFHFKMGNFKKVVHSLLENKILKKSINHIDWLLYVNVSLLLLKIFLDLKQTKVVNVIINDLDDFFNVTLKEKHKETLKPNICDYLNSREVVNGLLSLDESFCVLNLFKSYKLLIENKSDESKKYLKEYKRIYTNCKYKDQLPIFATTKNLYHYLKIRGDYNNNSFFKCYKHLNSLYSGMVKNNTEAEIERQLFYYNAIGIINLRQKKYTLAQCFFKHCLLLLKNNPNFIGKLKIQAECANWVAYVKYNIGLCLFFEKNYERAYRVFSSLPRYLNNYPFLSYRIGVCSLEVELNNLKNESLNSHNEILDKLIGYNDESRQEKINGVGVASNIPNIGLSLGNLSNIPLSPINHHKYSDAETTSNLKNLNDQPSFQVGNVSNIPDINVKRILLRNNSKQQEGPNGKISSKYLHEAVKYFKETILLLKDNVYLKKEIDEVLKFYAEKPENQGLNEDKLGGSQSSEAPSQADHPSEIKSHQQIMTSCYLNLIFSLILSEEWNEVLYFCEEFEKNPNFTRESEYIIDNYKIEAYLALNQHKNILEILKKNMLNNTFSYTSLDSRGCFYNKVNKLVYSELNYKLALYINIIKMNFITNNLVEAEKGILSILNLLNVNFTMTNGILSHADLPPYILNLIIYYLIVKENFDAAIQVIKRRRVPPVLAQYIFQPAAAVGNVASGAGAKLPFTMK
jgi:hypothetical protein